MSLDRPITGYRFVEVRSGDTLQRIAARELGDGARWPELVSFNALVPPFITDDPASIAEGVARPGQFLRVPAAAVIASAEADPDEVFERDVELRGRRLLGVDGDFAVVAGAANLKQALRHRVETEEGELSFHPTYGSGLMRVRGSVNGPTAGLLCAQLARAAVESDPRVSAVGRAEAVITGDAISVEVEVFPITGKPVDVATTI